MAQTAYFFNGVSVDGVYDRRYSADDLAAATALLVSNGVLPAEGNQLAVSPGSSGLKVQIATGGAIVQGRMYKNNAAATLTLSTAPTTAGQKRWDRIVLRLDTTNRTLAATIRQGTAAASPSIPDLVRSGATYELCLADVLVSAGATAVTAAQIYDRRSDADLCGFCQWLVNNVDFTSLYAQYTAQFEDWFEDIQGQLSGDVATALAARCTALEAEDQVLAAAIEAHGFKVLWTNANPSASFGPQTVNVPNMSSYPMLVFIADSDGVRYSTIAMNVIGTKPRLIGIQYQGKGVGQRSATISDNQITFSEYYYNGAVLNTSMIPIAIYGFSPVTA